MSEFYRPYKYDALPRVTGFDDIYGYKPTVAIVDDSEGSLYLTGYLLNRAGIKPKGIWVNNEYHPSNIEVEAFLKSFDPYKLHAAVIDKSMGYFDTITFTQRVRERRIPNLLHTGEANTREKHRVATSYLEKGIPYENVHLLIHVLLLLNLNDESIVDVFSRARDGFDRLLPDRSMMSIPVCDKDGHIISYSYEYYPEGDKDEIRRYNSAILSFSGHDFKGLLM